MSIDNSFDLELGENILRVDQEGEDNSTARQKSLEAILLKREKLRHRNTSTIAYLP